MRLTTDDKVDSVVDGYNVPVRRIAVLTLPRGLVTCSMLKSSVASKQAVRFIFFSVALCWHTRCHDRIDIWW